MTALNLEPIFVARILYPPGTLFGLIRIGSPSYVRESEHQIFDTTEIMELVPLRLTIFSLSNSKEREQAFGNHCTEFRTLIKQTS